MKRMMEIGQRDGHLPGAQSLPSSTPVASDGLFESAEELQTIYLEPKDIDPKRPTIACYVIPGMHQIIE
jgi:3-mercaptopyruvate sulfurtransferase SseA